MALIVNGVEISDAKVYGRRSGITTNLDSVKVGTVEVWTSVPPLDPNVVYTIIEGTQNCSVMKANDNIRSARINEKVLINGQIYTCTYIASEGFLRCISLTSIAIPNSVTKIGGSAFKECRNLTSITIANSVTIIGRMAFLGCSSLTSVTIPQGVTSIESYAFKGCSSLTSITYTGTIAQYQAIRKGTDWHLQVPATVVHCTDGDTPI